MSLSMPDEKKANTNTLPGNTTYTNTNTNTSTNITNTNTNTSNDADIDEDSAIVRGHRGRA